MKTVLRIVSLAVSLALTAACSPAAAHAPGGPELGQPGTLPLADIQKMVKEPSLHVAFVPDAPLGISDLEGHIPADNPLTRAKVELGSQLFFDARLSRDGTLACATCHHPSTGWAGIRAPTIANRILGHTQLRDGRAASLEQQALGALASPIEMGSTVEDATARLNEIEGYRIQFEAVFGGPATGERIAKAIAAFERTILTGSSKFDIHERARPFLGHEAGDDDTPEFLERMRTALAAEERLRMSASALRGRELFFGKATCSVCHVGQDLSDELFHDLGIGMEAKEPDLGRYAVTKDEKDKGAFRTPTVRNIAKTAPYMHDGSLKTLRDVVEHYAKGGTIAPVELTEQDKLDLVAFLEEGLTGQTTLLSIPRLP